MSNNVPWGRGGSLLSDSARKQSGDGQFSDEMGRGSEMSSETCMRSTM